MNFAGLKECCSLMSVKYFIGDFEIALHKISQDSWKRRVKYLGVDSQPNSIFLENMKGTSSAESDNLSACITRKIGSYLEEDNISLLIKDMDEKEVCRIIPHKHLKQKKTKGKFSLPLCRQFFLYLQ